jgi:DNA-binding Lrp family transcriptional regulator|tara:strand:+ start:229 stop:1146 length:918 start_codon:yes stop_codon:yes gene_type:complete
VKLSKIDNLDVRILSNLLNNCRESDRQIGQKIGLSGVAVKSRINKMLKSKLIEKFTLKIEPHLLGYNVIYLVTTGQDVNEIVKQVKLVGEPFFIVPCVGGISACGIVVKGEVEQKIAIINNLLKEVRILNIFEAEDAGIKSNLTKTDLDVIEHLLKDPQEQIDIIAKNLHLSTKTVTRSIEKLQKNPAFQFTLTYNPSKIKPYISHAILCVVNGNIQNLLKTLKIQFEDHFMQIPFIAKNQIALFLYSEDIFEMDELVQKARSVENVISAENFMPKKISLPYDWIRNAIKENRKSERLHLLRVTT